MSSRFLMSRPAVCVLRFNVSTTLRYVKETNTYMGDVCFDHNRSGGHCDGNSVEGHNFNGSCIGRFAANGIEPSEVHPERQCNKFGFQTKMEQWQHVRPADVDHPRRSREL